MYLHQVESEIFAFMVDVKFPVTGLLAFRRDVIFYSGRNVSFGLFRVFRMFFGHFFRMLRMLLCFER